MQHNNPTISLTYVKQSPIHGFGVFAAQDIRKGTIWWKGMSDENILLLTRLNYESLKLSEPNQLKKTFWKMFSTYSYYSTKLDSLILCLDNARYVNHSDYPNSGPSQNQNPLISIALRNIDKDEEICEDYDQYDQCPWAMVLKFDEELSSDF